MVAIPYKGMSWSWRKKIPSWKKVEQILKMWEYPIEKQQKAVMTSSKKNFQILKSVVSYFRLDFVVQVSTTHTNIHTDRDRPGTTYSVLKWLNIKTYRYQCRRRRDKRWRRERKRSTWLLATLTILFFHPNFGPTRNTRVSPMR